MEEFQQSEVHHNPTLSPSQLINVRVQLLDAAAKALCRIKGAGCPRQHSLVTREPVFCSQRPPPPFFFIFKPLPVLSRRFLSRCAISFCLFASLKQTLTNLDLKLALGHKQNKTWQHMMSVKRIVTAFASFIHYSTEVMWLTWWTDMKVISER